MLCNGTLCHVLPTWRGRGEKKEEEKVSGCSSGGMSRVGNLSVSTHVSAAASCSSGTVHLSACVSARLAVWHPLLPTLPDFEREQSHYFSHGGTRPATHLSAHTLTLAAPSRLAVTTLHKRMRFCFFFIMVSRCTCSHFTHLTMRNHCRGKRQTHAAITTHPNTEVGDLQPSLSCEDQKRLEPGVEEINSKGEKMVSQIEWSIVGSATTTI